MHSQKKGTAPKRARSSHSLKKPAQQNPHKYGPLLMKKPPINEIIGYTLSHQPMGLKKHIRSSSCSTSDKDKESYFDLALRTGELNFFRRFKNVRYLENFSSKKNMYNICEETVISRLMNQVSEVNRQSRICKSRKRMEVRF